MRWNPLGLNDPRRRALEPFWGVGDEDGELPPVAVARLADLLRSTAITLEVDPPEVTSRLPIEEIAERLGSTPAFIERVLPDAIARAMQDDETSVTRSRVHRFTRLRDVEHR